MTLLEGLQYFTSQLALQKIEYGVIGGLAVFAYGGQRTTFDVDFLIHKNHRDQVKQIAQQMQLRIVNENNEVLQLSGPVQFDIVFANRRASQAMLNRLRLLPHFPYPVVAPEDLIGLKIQAFSGDRSREFIDKNDIFELFKNVANLNLDLIKDYADLFNVWPEIEDLRNRI